MAKFCGNCGQQISDDAAVCGYCGVPVGGSAPAAPNAAPGAMPNGMPGAPRPAGAAQSPLAGFKMPQIDKEKIIKIAKIAVPALVGLIVAIIVICAIIANTGINGAVGKVEKAYKKLDTKSITSIICEEAKDDDNYDEDQVNEYWATKLDNAKDYYADQVGSDKFKLEFEKKEEKKLTGTRTKEVFSIFGYDPEDADGVEMKSVKVKVTAKKGKRKETTNADLYFVKEGGNWKLFTDVNGSTRSNLESVYSYGLDDLYDDLYDYVY